MTHHGSCHCGTVQFDVEGDIRKVYDCNCSHCRRKGFLLWFAPRAQFTLTAGEDALATYTFNKHTIQHRFCQTCGCAPFAYGKAPDGSDTAAINVRCLPDVALDGLEIQPVDGASF
ncbi:MAG TPA: GFA family protein [Rhodanobacteraceae bacterium]|nr:GFA family protein [Rhodanobacteraceae bacterium]